MKKSIFIVVNVHYDYHRFQKNLYASNNQQDCIEWAKNYNKKQKRNLPIIKTFKTSIKKNNIEIEHLWIQKF